AQPSLKSTSASGLSGFLSKNNSASVGQWSSKGRVNFLDVSIMPDSFFSAAAISASKKLSPVEGIGCCRPSIVIRAAIGQAWNLPLLSVQKYRTLLGTW